MPSSFIAQRIKRAKHKEFARWMKQQRNASSNAERMVSRTESAGSASMLDYQFGTYAINLRPIA